MHRWSIHYQRCMLIKFWPSKWNKKCRKVSFPFFALRNTRVVNYFLIQNRYWNGSYIGIWTILQEIRKLVLHCLWIDSVIITGDFVWELIHVHVLTYYFHFLARATVYPRVIKMNDGSTTTILTTTITTTLTEMTKK